MDFDYTTLKLKLRLITILWLHGVSMIKVFQVHARDNIDEHEPWLGILSAVMIEIKSTYYTTLEVTLMQLVFGREAILPIF